MRVRARARDTRQTSICQHKEKSVRVLCSIQTGYADGDYGEVECTTAECPRCGNHTLSWGTSEASERRCLVIMRETCLKYERNFYVSEHPTD